MKTIVHVVQHLRPGGIECLVLEIMKHNLSEQNGDQVFIVSLEGDKQDALNNWPRLRGYHDRLFFLNKESGHSIKTLLSLVSLLRDLGVDVVHTHHIGPLIYGGLAGVVARVHHRIHTEHDAWHLENNKRRILEKIILNIVQPELVADANFVAEKMHQYQLGYQSKTIHNGIDASYFDKGDKLLARNRIGLDKLLINHGRNVAHSRVIGCAGRLVAVKGHQYLIRAMTQLPQDIVLVLAGEGEEYQTLKGSIEKYGLSNRVFLLGSIIDMKSFYQAIDVFAMASLNEGLPLSPLEAQACGVPVVLTRVGGCHEACCSETGILVPSENSDALAWGIRKQLKRKEQGELIETRSFIKSQRSLTSMVQQYRELIAK